MKLKERMVSHKKVVTIDGVIKNVVFDKIRDQKPEKLEKYKPQEVPQG